MNEKTGSWWADEVIRRIEADPNSDLAPVAVGRMITAQAFAEAIAAAEERGRRKGVEGAAKLCDAEREAAWKSSLEADARGDYRIGTADANTAATAQRLADAIRALLAPRDSGKEES